MRKRIKNARYFFANENACNSSKQASPCKDQTQVFYFANAGAQLARALSLQGISCSSSASDISLQGLALSKNTR